MKILVTGGAGFIGSHLVADLCEQGHEVTVLDDLSTGSAEAVHPAASLYRGDVRDVSSVELLVADVDQVYHLASVVGVQRYVREPRLTIDTIVNGTESVVRACEGWGARLLVTSTSEVYGRTDKVPMAEDDDLQYGATAYWRWSYGMAKALDEMIVLKESRDNALDGRVVRLFNTVGRGQSGSYGMVMARFVEAALSGAPLVVHGDGLQTRAFCDVRDVVRALQLVMDCEQARGEVINIGGTVEWEIVDLAAFVRSTLESTSPIQHMSHWQVYGPAFEDIRRRVPDTSKIERLTGWAPRHSLSDTIQWMAAVEAGV